MKVKDEEMQIGDRARTIAGWTLSNYGTSTYDYLEMQHLAQAALEVPDGGLIAEIGVYSGCSASILFQAARGRDVTVLLCDVFAWMWDAQAKERLATTLQLFDDVPVIDGLYRSSEEAVHLTSERIDLLHIDGDHNEAAVRKDFELWLPKMQDGGVIAVHDVQSEDGTIGHVSQFPGYSEEVRRWVEAEGMEVLWHGGSYGLLLVKKGVGAAV